jgi:FOG: WD40 repeat
MSSAKSTKKRPWSLQIPASNIIHLIQHYLIENGLRETSAALLSETQIGCRGLLQHAHTHIVKKCKEGDWGSVLETLSILTPYDSSNSSSSTMDGQEEMHARRRKAMEFHRILAQVHEMAILELADASEMDLAFATLKVCRDFLNVEGEEEEEEEEDKERTADSLNDSSKDLGHVWGDTGNLSNSIERRLHEIQALRSVRAMAAADMSLMTAAGGDQSRMGGEKQSLLPPDYYGPNNVSKEKRRKEIAKKLGEVIPIIPSYRLVSLLQQAIKWQVHTGEMPMVQELVGGEEDEAEVMDDVSKEDGRKKRKKAKKVKRFDLVLGNISVDNTTSDVLSGIHGNGDHGYSKGSSQSIHEIVPSYPYSTLKFGKKSFVASCLFYTDSSVNQTSLITGTSDGFIEIWDEDSRFTKLRMDLDYQKNGEIMCHDNDSVDDDGKGGTLPPSILAMAMNAEGTMLASGDSRGTIVVWNVQTGQSLVELERVHSGAITCLEFSRDGSKILSASQDGLCREFGLRTKRMLKEFRGHGSFVNCCYYVVPTVHSTNDELLIVTASADSTVRVWCGRSAEEKICT